LPLGCWVARLDPGWVRGHGQGGILGGAGAVLEFGVASRGENLIGFTVGSDPPDDKGLGIGAIARDREEVSARLVEHYRFRNGADTCKT